MVETELFHIFIKFSFNHIDKISHSEKGYTAASSIDDTIVIWKNYEIGPNIHEGKVISIIIDQFESIDQIQWIFGTEDLLIRSGQRIVRWDIYENKEKTTYLTMEPILYAKRMSLGILIVKESGKFSLYTESSEISSQIGSDIIIDVNEGVYVYPTLYSVDEEGEWSEEEPGMSWSERGLRRLFEGSNLIQINGDFIRLDNEEYPNLAIPEEFRHHFDDGGITIVKTINDGFLIRNQKFSLLVQRKPKLEAISLEGNQQIIENDNFSYLHLQDSKDQQRIMLKSKKYIIEPLTVEITGKDLRLDNIVPSMYLDLEQDLKYARYSDKHYFLWYPDLENDYVFIDLLTGDGSIFSNFGRDHHEYILVERWGKEILQWQKGQNYPSGTLKLFDLENPTKLPETIYDEKISTKRVDIDEFRNNSEDLEFPLVLPDWHKIELWLFYKEPITSIQLSYSQYFALVERLSQSENAALLKYQDYIPEEIAFIHFGDLILELGETTVKFEQIAPEWTLHSETGQLAYYSADGHIYIINTFDDYLLPIYAVKSQFPFSMDFSPNGQYLILIAFEIKKTKIQAHPQEQDSFIETEFPHLTISIHDIFQQKSYNKTVRFPHLLDYRDINLDFQKGRILIFFPSYTDNRDESVVMFDTNNNQFHHVNGSEFYRLWMTHSKNSPIERINKGQEFPVEDHPEISRDYGMRPFDIYEGVLVRKEDQIAITMADINLEEVPQQSTLDLYDLENTTILEVPFYYTERKKEIHLSRDKITATKLKDFYPLDKISYLPLVIHLEMDKVPRNKSLRLRIVELFKSLIANEVVHSNTGVAFEHPNIGAYQNAIKKLIDEYS